MWYSIASTSYNTAKGEYHQAKSGGKWSDTGERGKYNSSLMLFHSIYAIIIEGCTLASTSIRCCREPNLRSYFWKSHSGCTSSTSTTSSNSTSGCTSSTSSTYAITCTPSKSKWEANFKKAHKINGQQPRTCIARNKDTWNHHCTADVSVQETGETGSSEETISHLLFLLSYLFVFSLSLTWCVLCRSLDV